MTNTMTGWNIFSPAFGLIAIAIGVINLFWGNDPFFGAFMILLSLVYFPPVTAIFTKWTGWSVHYLVKILLALFILWAALGVGELADKIELMRQDVS